MNTSCCVSQYDVFISHSSKECDVADEICTYLESNGVSCWIAPRDVRSGHDYASEIVKAIKACRVFVLVLTNSANGSGHIANEVDRAFNCKKSIIPFKIQEVQLSSTLEYYLCKTHWLVAMPNRQDRYPDLLEKCTSKKVGLLSVKITTTDNSHHLLLPATNPNSDLKPSPPALTLANEERFHSEQVVKVVGNHAPPARIFDQGTASGYYFDIMRAIGVDQDLQLQFIQASFDMSIKMLKMGKAHVMIGPNKTPDRENQFLYSNIPLKPAKKTFYVNVNANPILQYEDLHAFILITMKNTFYGSKIATDTNLTKVQITNYKTGIQMVNNSERYVIVMPENQGDYLLEELGIDLMKSPFDLQGVSSYIVYNRNAPKPIVSAIEKGLHNIMNNSTYNNILDMYY